MSRRTTTRALQAVLAAEHAVVYGYGDVGARLSGAGRQRAVAAYDGHRRARDGLLTLLSDRGVEPVAAAPAYALPHPVTSRPDAALLATLLEERLAAVYADAVVATTGGLRDLAIDGLRAAAVRAAEWRGGSVPFPGLPERAS